MNPIQYLYFRAKCQPEDPAVWTLRGHLTWKALLNSVRSVALSIRDAGSVPGQVAATAFDDFVTEWIVTLALMHEAVASCTVIGSPPSQLKPDVILGPPTLRRDLHNTMVVDDAVLKRGVPSDFAPRDFANEQSLFRLVLTSGTTGETKAAEFTLAAFLRRCEQHGVPSEAYVTEMCMMGLPSITGFTLALRKLFRGVVIFDAGPRTTIELCTVFNPECLSGSPNQFSALLKELKNTSRRFPSLKLVWYAGAQASAALVHEMRQTLCPNVACVYGSTEVGAISSCFVHDPSYQPGMAGYLLPDLTAQIVDNADNILELGCEGIIRVKSSSMARGYHGDEAETLRVFHDGWFYPGDRGKLSKNDVLELTGRSSEIINRGGTKIDPFQIDVVAQSYPGVIDAASFGYEDEQGLADICLAVVASEAFNWDGLAQHLRGTLAPESRPSSYLKVSTVPRNAVGKVMRNHLTQAKISAGIERKKS